MLEFGSENYSKPNFTNITLFHFSQNLFIQQYVIVGPKPKHSKVTQVT